MKYLKKFEKTSEYDDFKNGSEWVTPNVSYIVEHSSLNFQPYVPPSPPILLGEIAYWDGSSVKVCTIEAWSSTLGTPIGVVVVPEGFAPDGKVRIVSLNPVDSSGNPSDSDVDMTWGPTTVDTPLTCYDGVPTTDNAGSTSTGSYSSGFLPSDKFTGTQSFVDPTTKYNERANFFIPSPYLGDNSTFNPEYSKDISGYNNALSDFNGLTNTQTLVGLGSDYQAANAAWKYTDGASNLQWYLPGMGELGYILPRFNLINTSLTAIGGVAVNGIGCFWSSTEHFSSSAFNLSTYSGQVGYITKTNNFSVRPFAALA